MGKSLMRNTALLTGSSLVMRCISLVFQVWLVGAIGSAGIGLFQLVMSVGMLASTFAISGIRFASTRIISEEIGLNRPSGVSRAVWRCSLYSLVFGCAAFLLLYFGAEPIGFLWVGDARTVLSLRIFSVSLPFAALTAVFAGYFTATGRVFKSAAVQVAQQLVHIALVVVFLGLAPEGDLEKSCAAVTAGALRQIWFPSCCFSPCISPTGAAIWAIRVLLPVLLPGCWGWPSRWLSPPMPGLPCPRWNTCWCPGS